MCSSAIERLIHASEEREERKKGNINVQVHRKDINKNTASILQRQHMDVVKVVVLSGKSPDDISVCHGARFG